MTRIRVVDDDSSGGNYFTDPKQDIEFIHTGWVGLDCVLGGGWPIGRISNIVGDRSTAKTLLAIEACTNFSRLYPDGEIFYRESEAAFDQRYAEALGLPLNRVSFIDREQKEFLTIENFYDDLVECVDLLNEKKVPGLYVLDSLDGLSDDAELKREFDEQTYAMTKAKQLGKLFRLCTSKIRSSRMHLQIISQERDKINAAMFGKKSTRSGGRALDFYASQILWLSHLETVNHTIKKVKRPTAIKIKAKCEKNKISLPYRQCEFTVSFGMGIDCMESSLDLLDELGALDRVLDGMKRPAYKTSLDKLSDEEYWAEIKKVDSIVTEAWRGVEASFLEGVRRKY